MWRLFVKIDQVLQETYTGDSNNTESARRANQQNVSALFDTDIAKEAMLGSTTARRLDEVAPC